MGLLQIIKKNPNVRKIFGKRELKIIEKQLMGVKLKPSEIIRLSRDIRKKFDAIRELSQYPSEFGLKKGMIIKEMIGEAKEIILESEYFPKIRRIILFGSAVENQITLSSDIDIAVEFDEITNKEALFFRRVMLSKVDERIDVQVLNILPEKVKKEIQEKGKVLYEGKNK